MSSEANPSVKSLWSDAASGAGGSSDGAQSGAGSAQGQGTQGQGQGTSQGQSQQSSQQGSQQGQQGQQGAGSQAGAGTQQTPPAGGEVKMSPDELAAAFLKVSQGAQAQQQQPTAQQQKQMTPEELDRAFNRFRVTPEIYAEIFDAESPEKSIAALNKLVEGSVKQAVTMAYHVLQDQMGQFNSRIQPYMSFADEQREQMLRNQYFAEFPDHKSLDPIIEQVHQQLKSSGYKPKNTKELFTEVGKRVNAIVDQLKAAAGVTGGGAQGATAGAQGGGQQQVQQQASQKPQMSSLKSGGQGGEPAGSSSGGGNKVKALWG